MFPKLTVIGPSSVGKTHFIYQLLDYPIPDNFQITLAIDCLLNKDKNMMLMDYSGSKRIFFRQIEKTDLLVVILSDQLTNPLQEYNYYRHHNIYKFPLVVVYNNIEGTGMPTELEEYFKQHETTYFNVNCKTGQGIDTVKNWLENKWSISI